MRTRDLILAIETSNASAAHDGAGPGVALGRLGAPGSSPALLGIERLRVVGRNEDDLLPAIDRLFRAAGASARDLGRVAVSVGPGGFTALRVACAAGQMIAEATGARCVPVPSAMVAAARLAAGDRAGEGGRFGVALASKGESAFVAVFESGGREPVRSAVMDAAEIRELRLRLLAADRFLPESMRAAVAECAGRIVEPVFDPVACLELAAALPDADPGALLPFYPREPEAVTLWRKRAAGPS